MRTHAEPRRRRAAETQRRGLLWCLRGTSVCGMASACSGFLCFVLLCVSATLREAISENVLRCGGFFLLQWAGRFFGGDLLFCSRSPKMRDAVCRGVCSRSWESSLPGDQIVPACGPLIESSSTGASPASAQTFNGDRPTVRSRCIRQARGCSALLALGTNDGCGGSRPCPFPQTNFSRRST